MLDATVISRVRPVQLLIVDDDALVRTGLKLLLRDDPKIAIVGEVNSVKQAMRFLEGHQVDVALLDVMMPGGSGLSGAALIATRFPRVRVVLMSTIHPDVVRQNGANTGVKYFVSKTASRTEFRAAILDVPADADESPRATGGFSALSLRERQIVALVARGMTNDDIAKRLKLATNTVKTYVSRASSKVGATNRVQLANRYQESLQENPED